MTHQTDLLTKKLERKNKHLDAIMSLFEEARDAITALTRNQCKLHKISFTLADRMDEVGIPQRWLESQGWKRMTLKEAGSESDDPELAWFSPEPGCTQEDGEPSWVFERWNSDA